MKQLISQGKQLTFAGAHNAFIAKLAQRAGFNGVYISGAGLSNSHAVTDTGILRLEDFCYAGRFISRAVTVPVLADADTGFDDAANTVKEYIAAGISGLHLEDQVFPKRCGHLDGKEVVDSAEMEEKIRAAAKARDALNEDFLIIARTDARGAMNVDEGGQFAESVRRGQAYLAAGADAIFPESMRSVEEFKTYRKEVSGPLLGNMTEFGKSPFITAAEFHDMGFQIVIFPVTMFRYLAGFAARGLETLLKDGDQRNMVPDMLPRAEINKILDYDVKV